MEELRIRFNNQSEHGIGYGSSVQIMLTPLRALRGIWDYVIECHGPLGWSEISQGTIANL